MSAIIEATTWATTAAGVPKPIINANANVVDAVSSSTSPPRGTEIGKTSPTNSRSARSPNARSLAAASSDGCAANQTNSEQPATVTSATYVSNERPRTVI